MPNYDGPAEDIANLKAENAKLQEKYRQLIFTKIEKLHPQPGDLVVVKTDDVDEETCAALHRAVKDSLHARGYMPDQKVGLVLIDREDTFVVVQPDQVPVICVDSSPEDRAEANRRAEAAGSHAIFLGPQSPDFGEWLLSDNGWPKDKDLLQSSLERIRDALHPSHDDSEPMIARLADATERVCKAVDRVREAAETARSGGGHLSVADVGARAAAALLACKRLHDDSPDLAGFNRETAHLIRAAAAQVEA